MLQKRRWADKRLCLPGLENQSIALGKHLHLSVKIKYSSAGIVGLHFGVAFYRKEANTGKETTINISSMQCTICMHDQVNALK